MLGLLLPLGLLTLAGVLVPLLLHLARRSDGVVVPFAALKWLEAAPRPKARVRFDEVPLLLVRMLLLAVLALLIAQPVWRDWVADRPVVAVVPGVDLVEARARVAGLEGARAVWLAPGWPAFGDDVPAPGATASLLRALDAGLAPGTALTVFVPDPVGGLDGGVIALSRLVTWEALGSSAPLTQAAGARPKWSVRVASASAPAARWFRASAAALGRPVEVADLDAPLPALTSPMIWLDEGPLPARVNAWVEAGGVALVSSQIEGAVPIWQGADGTPVALGLGVGRGRLLHLGPTLEPAAFPMLLEPDFPVRLAALLEGPMASPQTAPAELVRPVAGGPAPVLTGVDLSPALALLLALLWLIERWLATSKARRVQS